MGYDKATTTDGQAITERADETNVEPIPSIQTCLDQGRRGSLGVAPGLLKAVIKVFAVRTEPNLSMPWQMKRQYSSTASGFVISGRRIVTNAHAVSFQTSIRVRKHGSAEKFVARLIGVGHQCDLAMLTVDDDSFWRDVEPLELEFGQGGMPSMQENVTVIGYPTGGDSISVTKGVVSRVEETYYSHGNFRLLAIQIDAAINPGNSGGPALMGTKVVGVCFETLINAENIGYIIPVPVIQHFIDDIDRNKGNYTGFCDIGIQIQLMESENIRKAMGMKANQTGVLVNRTCSLADASNVLQKDDVIMEIEGVSIGNDGTIPFRDGGERISFRYALLPKFDGEKVHLRILRGGQPMEVDVGVVLQPSMSLVPANQFDTPPSYFIHAGLVFQVLTQPFLCQEWGKDWQQKGPVRFVDKALFSSKDHIDQEVVILSQILAADINVTYQQYVPNMVTHFNKTPIRNLKHLVEMVESNQEPFLRFDLESERALILDSCDAASQSSTILEHHNIPYPKSADLRKLCQSASLAQPCKL